MDSTKIFKVGAICTLLFIVVSCGSDNNPVQIETPDSEPQVPIQNTFKAKIVYTNEFGKQVPHPRATVFLHDADWGVVDSQIPNEEGVVEFQITEDDMPVSVVS